MNFDCYRELEQLIAAQKTGTVEKLAKKLNVSPRHIKYMIKQLREVFKCPIDFNKEKNSYCYTVKGRCRFEFEECKIETIMENINRIVKGILS